jgi:hypothetical protein
MNKTYGRINWENYPSDETPLNESNLNKIDVATDEIDNRVITLDTTKATKAEVSTLVQDVAFEEKTGIITITKKNGSKIMIDTQMEKIAVNFSYNAETQQIILTLIDGTKQYIDLAALITQYEFLDSDTVAFSIDSAGKVSAIVKEASIQEKHLRPDYLADIKVEAAKAQASQLAAAKSESNAKASETAAAASESNAAASATKAQSYAVGGTNSRTGEDTDNAKYYSQQAEQSHLAAKNSADTASIKAGEATTSANTAQQYASNSAESANVANEKANSAANSATGATSSANTAQQYASNAAISASTAQNYAVADTDSAKYYYEQARRISESFSGALRPMGTVAFANLPVLSEVAGGSMYNISDQFTTTAEFKEGAGNTIPAGANVYKTEDGKWDVLAGTPVTGVKGSAESEYRRGNVNITAENVGLGNVDNTADSVKSVNYAASAGNAAKVNGHTVNSDVPANAKFTDTDTWRPQPDWNATSGDAMIKNKPSLGTAAEKNIRTLASVGSSGWQGANVDQNYVPDMAFIAYWNGAYSGSSSNLTYCNKGAFGTAATANKTDFATANHTHAYLPLAGGTMTGALNMNGKRTILYKNNYMEANEQDINIIAGGKDMFTGYINARVTSALQVRDTANTAWKPINALSFNQQSSARYKKNIANMTDEEALKLLKYRVVDYDYINEADGTGCQGLIAEEVAEICEYPVYRKPDGTIEGLDYSKFVPQLIKMIQIQQEQIERLEQKIEEIKQKL